MVIERNEWARNTRDPRLFRAMVGLPSLAGCQSDLTDWDGAAIYGPPTGPCARNPPLSRVEMDPSSTRRPPVVMPLPGTRGLPSGAALTAQTKRR